MIPAVVVEPIAVPALDLEHLIEREPVPAGVLFGMMHAVRRLVLDQRVGEIHVDGVHQGLEDPIADHALDLALLHLADLLAEIRAERIHRVELGGRLRERVIRVRELQRLDVLHEHLE